MVCSEMICDIKHGDTEVFYGHNLNVNIAS